MSRKLMILTSDILNVKVQSVALSVDSICIRFEHLMAYSHAYKFLSYVEYCVYSLQDL